MQPVVIACWKNQGTFILFYTRFLEHRPFLVIQGLSGSGKSTLAQKVVDSGGFSRPKSFTTRRQRRDEGFDEYEFISKDLFLSLFEVRFNYYDKYAGNLYAMDQQSISDIFSSGTIPIKEISIENIEKLKTKNNCLPLVVQLRGTYLNRAGRQETQSFQSTPFISISFDPNLSSLSDLPNYVRNWIYLMEKFGLIHGAEVWAELSEEDQKNLEGYNKVAPYFTDDQRITTRAFHEISRPFWTDKIEELSGSVLEIGPGHGWLRQAFLWNNLQYSGVDISEAMIELNPDVESISVCTLQHLQKKDATFDAVIGSLIDPCLTPTNLVHAYRILKPGGRFIGTVPGLEWAQTVRQSRDHSGRETVFSTPSGPARVTSYCFDQKEIYDMLNLTGFKNIEVIPLLVSETDAKILPPDIKSVVERTGSATPILFGWSASK